MQVRPRQRHGVRAVIAMVVTVVVLGDALAHPDERVIDATLTLAPGEVVTVPVSLHFHRLVTTYRVHEGMAPGITLRLVADPGAPEGRKAHTGAAPAVEAALLGEGVFHELVPCCLGAAYSDYRLDVSNDGAAPLTLDLRVWLVHDDFAVVAWRAEAGALEVPFALFLLLGVASTVTSTRGARRWRPGAVAPAVGPRGGVLLAWSVGLFVWACAVAVGLAAVGTARYGGGPVDAMIAVLADVHVPGGAFGSRAALVMGVLLLAWVGSIATWTGAVRRGAHARFAATTHIARAIALVSLIGGAAMAWTYASWSTPLGLALVIAVPLWASAGRLERARERVPAAA